MKKVLRVEPAGADHWNDLERLFGSRGACGGCWCMYFRRLKSEYEWSKGENNRIALRRLVTSGPPPGVLAFQDAEPVGWCAVGPRDEFPRLARSRAMRSPDGRPAWAVVCLFVAKGHRRCGVSVALLRGAAGYASSRGARLVEGYPVEPRSGDMPDVFAWTGTAAAFRAAGFVEAARTLPGRPVMRRELNGQERIAPPSPDQM